MIPSVLSSTPAVVADVPLRIDPDEVLRFQGYITQCWRCWMKECADRRAPAHRTVRRE